MNLFLFLHWWTHNAYYISQCILLYQGYAVIIAFVTLKINLVHTFALLQV